MNPVLLVSRLGAGVIATIAGNRLSPRAYEARAKNKNTA